MFVLGGVEGAAFVDAAPPPASGDWLQPVSSVHNAKPNSTIRVDILFIVAVGFMKTAIGARKIFRPRIYPERDLFLTLRGVPAIDKMRMNLLGRIHGPCGPGE